jgi:hypothetical protein
VSVRIDVCVQLWRAAPTSAEKGGPDASAKRGVRKKWLKLRIWADGEEGDSLGSQSTTAHKSHLPDSPTNFKEADRHPS